MSQPYLTVVAEILAKPGKENEVRKHLLGFIDPTRQEEGCVQYDLHESTENPGHFIFYENWTSREMLDKHSKSPHIQAFRPLKEELLAQPTRIITARRIA